MKKAVLVLLLFAVVFCSCGKKETAATKADFSALVNALPQTPDVIDIRENMFLTQMNDLGLNYRTYIGKTLRLQGMFKQLHWNDQDTYYVYRRTPGCCGDDGEIAIELSWDQNYMGRNVSGENYTYPVMNDWVEVQGELKSYIRSGYVFLYVALSELNILEERGAEFVTR